MDREVGSMNGFEEMVQDAPVEEVKRWLFQENIRIQTEKQELKELKESLQDEKRKIAFEKESLKRKIAFEDKRFQANENIITQKQKILESGFRQLNDDKMLFEREKQKAKGQASLTQNQFENVGVLFFSGVNNPLALKKRYKDLLKIYHPDNSCGDEAVVVAINKEYDMLKNSF